MQAMHLRYQDSWDAIWRGLGLQQAVADRVLAVQAKVDKGWLGHSEGRVADWQDILRATGAVPGWVATDARLEQGCARVC